MTTQLFDLTINHADAPNELHKELTALEVAARVPDVLKPVVKDYELSYLKVVFDLVSYEVKESETAESVDRQVSRLAENAENILSRIHNNPEVAKAEGRTPEPVKVEKKIVPVWDGSDFEDKTVFFVSKFDGLTDLEKYQIIDAVKTCGTSDPEEVLSYFEESLTGESYRKLYGFLAWVYKEDKRFSQYNIDAVYTEYLENPYPKYKLDDFVDWQEVDTVFCSKCESREWPQSQREWNLMKKDKTCDNCGAGEDYLTVTPRPSDE